MKGGIRHQAVVAGFVGVFLLGPISGALADTRALWHMNDTDNTMTDSSSYNNHGTTHNVTAGDGLYSGMFLFNGVDSYVTVPESDSLDPFDQNITVTAMVSLTGPILDDSYDIVRKGLGNTPGGDWKMEIKNIQRLGTVGKLKCTFKGAAKTAKPDIMDGQAHELKCIKTPTSITATVDGVAYRKSISVGPIANNAGTMVGARVQGDDVYNGYLDEVRVEIG